MLCTVPCSSNPYSSCTTVLSPTHTTCIPMSSPEADVEVLVHITAPTTAGHDNVYRLQAEESLGFVPVSRVEVGRVIWPRTRTLMVEEDELGRLKELTADGSKREAEAEGQEEERPAKRARRGGLKSLADGMWRRC